MKKAEKEAKAAAKVTANAERKAKKEEKAAAKAKAKAEKAAAKAERGGKGKAPKITAKATSKISVTEPKVESPATPRTSSGATIEQVKGLLPTLLQQKDAPEIVSVTTSPGGTSRGTSSSSSGPSIADVKGILPTLLQQNDAPQMVGAATATATAAVAVATKKNPLEDMANDEGIFAPAVLLTKDILGTTELNGLRARIIKEHTAVIGKLTDTADSAFGDTVLKLLFELADKDGNGTIDEYELGRALNALGCGFIPEKQINGMFKRADKDGSCGLDYEEWCKAAPKTLKSALVKLAKKNGHELGFLA